MRIDGVDGNVVDRWKNQWCEIMKEADERTGGEGDELNDWWADGPSNELWGLEHRFARKSESELGPGFLGLSVTDTVLVAVR
jgi:hypothetical protein